MTWQLLFVDYGGGGPNASLFKKSAGWVEEIKLSKEIEESVKVPSVVVPLDASPCVSSPC